MAEGTKAPLRRDAQRNLERLVAAATEAFRERGLQVPLEDIAQRAGVSPGTLYNRFNGRDALIDAVMPALMEAQLREVLDRARRTDDPWDAFTLYVTLVCELQAISPALNDAVSSRFPDAEELTRLCDAQLGEVRGLIEAAHRSGQLRPDFTTEDLPYLLWSTSMVVRATAGDPPQAWRRSLALTIDGLRAEAAHPLPGPALTTQQVRDAMIRLGAAQR